MFQIHSHQSKFRQRINISKQNGGELELAATDY